MPWNFDPQPRDEANDRATRVQVSRARDERTVPAAARLDPRRPQAAAVPQQVRLLEHVLRGHADKQIARAMRVGVPTVRTYLSRVYDRTAAATASA